MPILWSARRRESVRLSTARRSSRQTTPNPCVRAVPRPVSTAGLRHGGPATTSRASGEVPDSFSSNPAEIVALFAWNGGLIDVTDVIDTPRLPY